MLPRWLGRLSSCLLKSISSVQFSPSAHTRRNFSLKIILLAESARTWDSSNSMRIDEQWECGTQCVIKMKERARGGEGATPVTHGLSRRLLRVKLPTSCAAKQKWLLKKKKKNLFCADLTWPGLTWPGLTWPGLTWSQYVELQTPLPHR